MKLVPIFIAALVATFTVGYIYKAQIKSGERIEIGNTVYRCMEAK